MRLLPKVFQSVLYITDMITSSGQVLETALSINEQRWPGDSDMTLRVLFVYDMTQQLSSV